MTAAGRQRKGGLKKGEVGHFLYSLLLVQPSISRGEIQTTCHSFRTDRGLSAAEEPRYPIIPRGNRPSSASTHGPNTTSSSVGVALPGALGAGRQVVVTQLTPDNFCCTTRSFSAEHSLECVVCPKAIGLPSSRRVCLKSPVLGAIISNLTIVSGLWFIPWLIMSPRLKWKCRFHNQYI